MAEVVRARRTGFRSGRYGQETARAMRWNQAPARTIHSLEVKVRSRHRRAGFMMAAVP